MAETMVEWEICGVCCHCLSWPTGGCGSGSTACECYMTWSINGMAHTMHRDDVDDKDEHVWDNKLILISTDIRRGKLLLYVCWWSVSILIRYKQFNGEMFIDIREHLWICRMEGVNLQDNFCFNAICWLQLFFCCAKNAFPAPIVSLTPLAA